MSGTSEYSRPSNPVRHCYPLAIDHAGFANAASLVGRTLPYAAVRFGILLVFSVVTIVWLIATFGMPLGEAMRQLQLLKPTSPPQLTSTPPIPPFLARPQPTSPPAAVQTPSEQKPK